MRSRWPILMLLCLLASLLVPGIASASTTSGAETRVWAFDLHDQVRVGLEASLTLELHPGCAPTYDELASNSLLAARGTRTLYHYTDDVGLEGIRSSNRLNPSLRSNNPRDVRYGEGQYLTDIAPGRKTCAQLSRCLIGNPFQGNRFRNYVELDVSGLNVVKGRDGVFVIPNTSPLDITNRIVRTGAN